MRLGIANDLPLAVEALRRALSLRPEHQVIWVAANGLEAVRLCTQQTPDVVLMDLMMPCLNGVEATRQIMATCPCAILIVTVNVRDHAGKVFEAMGAGALDAVDTPALGGGDMAKTAAVLLAKLDILKRFLNGKTTVMENVGSRTQEPAAARRSLVAIGASAGGPAALATVLAGLPKNFPAAVIISQHVDEMFAASLATWLNEKSNLPVRAAQEGDQPVPGQVLLAVKNDHLTLFKSVRLGYTADPLDYVYRPSVDVLFESVARYWKEEAVGVILTGMGRDGAKGLKIMRDRGFHTIAQDAATSAVFGMPKAAAQLGAAVEVLPLDKIARSLAQRFPAGP